MAATISERVRLPISNRYEFQKPMGTGGVGTVYRAWDRVATTHVAIKVLRYRQSENPVLHQRIIREFRAATELEHPNIVRALACETIDDVTFLVFELVEGGSLCDRFDRQPRFTEYEAVRIITQVTQALEYAHARGVIHRDVKPDNILMTPDGRAKLTDFGLAKTMDADQADLTRPASGLGTPQFMAPEQFSDAKHVGVRSDIYSLGATLYTLVTGRFPFDGKTPLAIMTQKEFERYPAAKSVVPGLSERVDAAIAASLKPNPDDRPKSCLAFFKLLTGRRRKGKDPAPVGMSLPGGSNRRVWARFTVGVGSTCSVDPGVQAGAPPESWPLVIRDVSAGGIGLLLARRFEPGTELVIEFGEADGRAAGKLTTRVIRVQGERNGHWVHGCKFSRQLAEEELSELVRLFAG